MIILPTWLLKVSWLQLPFDEHLHRSYFYIIWPFSRDLSTYSFSLSFSTIFNHSLSKSLTVKPTHCLQLMMQCIITHFQTIVLPWLFHEELAIVKISFTGIFQDCLRKMFSWCSCWLLDGASRTCRILSKAGPSHLFFSHLIRHISASSRCMPDSRGNCMAVKSIGI